MKKVFQLAVSLVLIVAIMFTVVSTGITVKAAEEGTLPSNAIVLTDGVFYTKYWTSNNYRLNCYNKIVVPSRGYITFTVAKPFDDEGEIGTFDFILYSENGDIVWAADTDAQQNSFSSYYVFKIGLAEGTYFMNIDPGFSVYSNSRPIESAYKFDFNKSSAWEIESNETQSTATKMSHGKMYTGVYGEQSYDTPCLDFFAVKLTKGRIYRLKFKNYGALDSGTAIFELLDPNGQEVYLDYAKEKDDITYWDLLVGTTGTFYLKLRNDGEELGFEYQVGVYEILRTPKLSKIANTTSGVKITWGKISGADKYYVYRKTGSGKYTKIGTTTKTYYTDKTAKSGKKYYYIVKAVNESGSSSSSKSLSIYYLDNPTLKTPTSTSKGINLKWTKKTGAEGYMIYRKTGSGSYSKIATVKGVSKISYTDTSAKKGKKYTYKVKAYKSKTYSAYSNTKTITDKY